MQKTKICDECQSEYFSETSKMESLCPNCASLLYGYENCEHKFKKGRCIHCYWNGNVSDFLKEKLYQEKLGTLKFDFCQSLKKMEELANKLEQNHFATTFLNGYLVLERKDISLKERLKISLEKTQVSGGMGSWNDSPPYIAYSKGLSDEYHLLTDEFFGVRDKIYKTLEEK